MNRERARVDWWPWAGSVFYVAIFTALGAWRYAAHGDLVDQGVFSQIAASAFGCFCSPLYGSQWAHHFSPILYLVGALMHLFPASMTLVVIQAIAGAFFPPAVYALVARVADRKTARMATAVAFLYPPLAGALFGDFYENAFAPAAVAWLLYAFECENVWGVGFLTLVTLSIKEDQAFFLAAGGVLGFIRYANNRRRATMAIAVSVVAVVVAATYLLVIQPHAPGGDPHWKERFFAWDAANFRALFPDGIAARAGFVLLAFAPLLFLPFRTPVALVAILPLAESLLSTSPVTYTIGQHYAEAWIGYVFYAFAEEVRRLFTQNPERVQRLLVACIALCILEMAIADPLHPGMLHVPSARDAALDRFLRSLPPNIDVATQEEAYTHLAATDARATLLPDSPDKRVDACYILIDRDFPESPRLREYGGIVRVLVADRTYRLLRRAGGIELYQRVGCR